MWSLGWALTVAPKDRPHLTGRRYDGFPLARSYTGRSRITPYINHTSGGWGRQV